MDLRAVAVAVVVVPLVGGCFELERTDGLRPGDIRVVVVDEAGDAVEGARVSAVGTERIGVSNGEGIAVVGPMPFGDYVLRVEVDDDDDGVIDRGAVIPTVTTIDKGLRAGLPRLGFVDHLDVEVAPTGSISGSVQCPIDRLCRVVAFRTAAGTTLPIEGNTAVDAAGRWQLDGVIGGDVRLAAFAWAPAASTTAVDQQLAATRPDGVGVVTATIGDDDVAIAIGTVAATSTAAIDIRVAPGLDDVSTDERPDLRATAEYILPGTLSTAAVVPRLIVEIPGDAVAIPLGVVDINVEFEGFGGRLFGVVGVPGLEAPLPPIAIGSFACELAEDVVDCNRDGSADYADLDAVDIDNDGIVDREDADVDSDGIDDVDEPAACVLVGAGGDRDGDCLCDAFDPLPDCQSNDPVLCTLPTAPTCS